MGAHDPVPTLRLGPSKIAECMHSLMADLGICTHYNLAMQGSRCLKLQICSIGAVNKHGCQGRTEKSCKPTCVVNQVIHPRAIEGIISLYCSFKHLRSWSTQIQREDPHSSTALSLHASFLHPLRVHKDLCQPLAYHPHTVFTCCGSE